MSAAYPTERMIRSRKRANGLTADQRSKQGRRRSEKARSPADRGLLCNSHVLLEGMLGLTRTPDRPDTGLVYSHGLPAHPVSRQTLLPADVIGTLIYNPRDGEFTTKLGPILPNLILADEINRVLAKVESALFWRRAGAAGHDRRCNVSAVRSVPCTRDAESH